MKKILLPIILVALVVAGVYAWKSVPRPNPLAAVPRVKAQKGEFIRSIDEEGVLRALKSEQIYAPYNGKITKIIEDGSDVEEGDTVIWLDTENVEQDLENQITSLKSTKTELEQTIERLLQGMRSQTLKVEQTAAELDFARLKLMEVNRKLETAELLFDKEIVAKTEVDDAEKTVRRESFNTLRTDLNFQKDLKDKKQEESGQEAELAKIKIRSEKAKKKIEDAREKITQAEIKTPKSGIFLLIQSYDWSKGKVAKPQEGDEVRPHHLLAEIPDLSSILILSQVSEADISRVELGQKAVITMDAFPDLEYGAKISRIGTAALSRSEAPGASSQQGAEMSLQKVFELELIPLEIDPRLRPGMSANVSIILEKDQDVLTLPLSSVYREDGQSVVYKVTKEGYKTIPVTLGRQNRDRVEILSGVKENDEVYNKNIGELSKES